MGLGKMGLVTVGWDTMGLGHNGPGTTWALGTMGLIHNETNAQLNWDTMGLGTMGLGHTGTDQYTWDWNTMGFGHNRTGTQWDRDTIGLGYNRTGM